MLEDCQKTPFACPLPMHGEGNRGEFCLEIPAQNQCTVHVTLKLLKFNFVISYVTSYSNHTGQDKRITVYQTLRNYNMINSNTFSPVNLLSPQNYAIMRHNEKKGCELKAELD
jgi:hypothetical protein